MRQTPTFMTGRFLKGATCTAVCLLAACGQEPSAEARLQRRPDVIFVLADTLRRDAVGVYADEPGLTPFVDSLAATATVFDNAWAQSSWTNPSIASIFTSRYQSQHHIISFGSHLQEQEVTLAEVLREGGYATGAFVANILLNEDRGFAQGFDEFQSVHRFGTFESDEIVTLLGRAEAVNRAALGWMDSLGEQRPPVFLYVHYMEPHIPYELPEPLLSEMLGPQRPDVNHINELLYLRPGNLSHEEIAAAKSLYSVAVRDLDAHLRELFDGLGERDLLDHAMVVFTADHGEEFSEHGWFGHGSSLYNEAVRVPLLVGMPGQTSRRDVRDNVELIDLASTIAEMAGVAVPATFEGRALARHDSSAAGFVHAGFRRLGSLLGRHGRPVVTELLRAEGAPRLTPHERAIVLGTKKLIRHDDGHLEYYDLREDAGERRPTRSFDGVPSALSNAFVEFSDHHAARPAPREAPEIDAETRERMRALGYAE